MFLRDVVASLARRWYLTLAGLLVTAGLAFIALQLVPPVWESKANVVLLPPKSTVEPGGNPYLQLGGLAPTLDLLVASLDDQEMEQLIKSVSPTAEYTVVADTTSSGPVLAVTVEDRTPANSLAARDQVVGQVPLKLDALQDNLTIPSRSRITSMVLTQDNKPEIVGKDQLRALVVAVGAGAVGTALMVALIDGYLTRRRLAAASGAGEVSVEVAAGSEFPQRAAQAVSLAGVDVASGAGEVSVEVAAGSEFPQRAPQAVSLAGVDVASGAGEASVEVAAGSEFPQRAPQALSLPGVDVASGAEETSSDPAADWESPWWHSPAHLVQSINGQRRPWRASDSPTDHYEERDDPRAAQASRAASAAARRL
jgi:hypothetical protein